VATSWREVLRRASTDLGSSQEARWLVERASGWEGAELLRHLDDVVAARGGTHVQAMVDRRTEGEPLQYVLGRWQFRSLDLLIDRRVLIPRPETEMVTEAALAELARVGRAAPLIVELGTGSGAIGLSLASEVPEAQVWATDVSTAALAVARANLTGLGTRTAKRVRLVDGDWWNALPDELRGTVDLVVTNPPYVAADEPLPPEVAEWEPVLALRAGSTGLEALQVVVGEARQWLRRPGVLVAEVAPHQAQAAVALAVDAGFDEVEMRPDLTGRPRALVARSPAAEA